MEFSKKHFEQLPTMAVRAAYLLEIGVSAKLNMVDLTPVLQACVGDVLLPVTGETEAAAIKKGTEWLKEKAAA